MFFSLSRALLASFPAIALCACATFGSGSDADLLQIQGLEFENRSGSPVTSIQLLVPATGNFVSCGRIEPGARCATRFPEVAYTGNPIEVKWFQGGAEWSTGAMSLNISNEARATGAGEVRVVVIAPGSAGVLLVPVASDGAVRNP